MSLEDDIDKKSRLQRYIDVSGAVGKVMLKAFVEKLWDQEIDHSRQAKDLKRMLGNLKGPLMKIAQFLATVPEAIPFEYAQQFIELQSQAPPMGAAFVERRMSTELGLLWRTKFAEFDFQASAAASLGQVHKAISHENQILACKLQYPNMQAVIEADLQQLKLILKVYEGYSKAIATEEIFKEIAERLFEELDYEEEAKNLQLYKHILNKYPDIIVPEYYPDFSTKRLLTVQWLEGVPIKKVMHLSQEERNNIASHLFHAWYYPLYHYGVIHGDPHLGNYLVGADQRVILLDFGCVRIFPAQLVQGVIDLYHAIYNNDQSLAVAAYEAWGFTNLNKATIEVLNLWAQLLYEPLIDDRVRSINGDKSPTHGRDIAQKVHSALQKVGGITPPRAFVFMDRAAVGIGSALMHLGAELNWHQLFNSLIQDFSVSKLRDRQQISLKKFDILRGSS